MDAKTYALNALKQAQALVEAAIRNAANEQDWDVVEATVAVREAMMRHRSWIVEDKEDGDTDDRMLTVNVDEWIASLNDTVKSDTLATLADYTEGMAE